MQQLTSVSLTSELQSETVQKGVRGATYDPLTETLFAASEQGKQSDRATSIIISISDKPQSEEAKHSLQQSGIERFSQSYSSQSHPANPKEHSSQSFRSLAETQSERRVVVSEANPKGLPQYLALFLLADRRADEPEYTTTDTLHEPDCLRFCPANSSGGIEISLSGFTAVAKLQSQTARANKAFSEGVHYIIKNFVFTLLGNNLPNKLPNPVDWSFEQELKRGGRLIIQNHYTKKRAKKVPAGQTWYPSVKFKEPEYFVIINPFAQGKGDLPEEVNSNHLPSSLRTSEIQLLNSYLTTKLKGMLVIYGLNQEMKENFETELKKTLRLDGSLI